METSATFVPLALYKHPASVAMQEIVLSRMRWGECTSDSRLGLKDLHANCKFKIGKDLL